MNLEFTKMHGLGNDFVVIDDRDDTWDLSPEAAEWLCDRHFGVGADGVILVRHAAASGRYYMHYLNADGSLAEMCGNGARCFAKYLIDREIVPAGEDAFTVETPGGPKHITVTRDTDGTMATATVDMGAPVLAPEDIPARFAGDRALDVSLDTDQGRVLLTAVSMGNPHAVLWVDDVDEAPVTTLGPMLEAHEAFPLHTNVEFVEVVSRDRVRMRVWERGVGETLACGTGACAAVVAAAATDRTGRSVTVELPGGELDIAWDETGTVLMSGSATEVFRGTIALQDDAE